MVSEAQRGDSSAFALLYKQYRKYILTVIGGTVRDNDAQHDVLQATFERAWVKIEALRDPSAFKPWLAQIARNLSIDHQRKQSRLVQTDFTDSANTAEIESDEWSGDDWAAMRELAVEVHAQIANLSARDAAVLEMATTFGFSATEIASALDIDTGHARVLLHRARQRLRAAVFGNETDH